LWRQRFSWICKCYGTTIGSALPERSHLDDK
jgi:hypothetical protein